MTTGHFRALEVAVDLLSVSPINVRQDPGDVSELADSIREQGVLEPLIVRPADDNRYEVIIGSRRLAAARELGLSTIPVVVQEISDTDALVRSLVENLQRGDLSLEERVGGYKRLQGMEPARFGSTRGLARLTGRTHTKIVQDFDAYEALQQLRPRGIEVVTALPPGAPQRKRGEAIPERHATMLQQAMTAVRGRIPQDRAEQTYSELARAIAPLDGDRARRVFDQFKMYPERPISEIVSMALATVQREITLPAETARRLEEITAEQGERDWSTAISRLVKESAPEENGAEPETPLLVREPSFDQPPLLGTESVEPPPVPRPLFRPVELPEDSLGEQLKNKAVWNITHGMIDADFYTVGYAGREMDQFIQILEAAKVRTLVDVRHSPVSPYKPQFSKENLAGALKTRDFVYIHRRDLGVPRDVRELAAGKNSRAGIWLWYKEHALADLTDGHLKEYLYTLQQPVALMCSEADPTACHRHLLFLELEGSGLRGYDL